LSQGGAGVAIPDPLAPGEMYTPSEFELALQGQNGVRLSASNSGPGAEGMSIIEMHGTVVYYADKIAAPLFVMGTGGAMVVGGGAMIGGSATTGPGAFLLAPAGFATMAEGAGIFYFGANMGIYNVNQVFGTSYWVDNSLGFGSH